jgi:hypothetical protein
MRILISDQNFGDDAQFEREAAEAAGVEITVESCRDEDHVASAIARYRPDALLVQFAPVGRKTLASAAGLRGIVRDSGSASGPIARRRKRPAGPVTT